MKRPKPWCAAYSSSVKSRGWSVDRGGVRSKTKKVWVHAVKFAGARSLFMDSIADSPIVSRSWVIARKALAAPVQEVLVL